MAYVYPLDAVDRRALARRHGRRGAGETVLVELPEGVSAVHAEPLLDGMLGDVAAAKRVATSLAALDSLPGPATLRALRDREAAWRDVADRYGLLSAADVARLAGSNSRNRSEYASALNRAGRILGVRRGGGLVFPAFQFDGDGRSWTALGSIIAELRQGGGRTNPSPCGSPRATATSGTLSRLRCSLTMRRRYSKPPGMPPPSSEPVAPRRTRPAAST